MGVKFKLIDNGKTVELSLRISSIANGWVIKAGDKPYFVFTEDEVHEAVRGMLAAYLEQPKGP
jgi:hypothetical protein